MSDSTSGIDVIIPVLNGESYIKQALLSVMRQTLKPFQIVVVDDGSIDGTKQVIQAISLDSTIPIKYIYQQNKGVSTARNTGIINSSSEYVAFLDADDSWKCSKLEEQFAVFQSDSSHKTGVVYTDIQLVDSSGNDIFEYSGDFLDRTLKGNIFASLIESNISSSASGVLVRRECFNAVGLFDASLATCEDWDMWLRIAEQYEFDYVADKLVTIRLHKNNASKDIYSMILGRIKVLNKLHERHKDDPLVMQELRYTVIRLIVQSLPSLRALTDIRRLLPDETRRQIFINVIGIAQAVCKGLYKVSRRL